jgi:cob(I)alamin adenosyltransferase
VIGLARAEAGPGSELDGLLVSVERDLWVLMSELATPPEHRAKLTAGQSLVTEQMVIALEELIDRTSARFEPPTEFVVPGQNRLAAQLDLARTVVRRAERHAIAVAGPGSHALAYLNRLSDLLWTLARWQEGESLATRSVPGR